MCLPWQNKRQDGAFPDSSPFGLGCLFYYYICSSPTCVSSSSWVWASSCTGALSLDQCQTPLLPSGLFLSTYCSDPDSVPHHLSHFASTLCHRYYFYQRLFFKQGQFFKILIRLFLRALGRKCFSFSLWESVGFELSASARTSWCHGRLTPPGLRSTDTKWAVSSCFLCFCFPTSLV